jgi:hypothetical protein
MEKRPVVKPQAGKPVEETVDPAAAGAPKVLTGFRHSPDVENFYRFVHENSLRKETRMLLERVVEKIYRQKKKKKSKLTQ